MSIIPPTQTELSQSFINKISHNPNVDEVLSTLKKIREEENNSSSHKTGIQNPCISYTHCVSLLDFNPNISILKSGLGRDNHILELKKFFIDKTNHGLDMSKKFLSGKSWVNEKLWKMGKIERNLNKEWLDRYVKTIQVWKEIEYITNQEELVPIFFTGTVVGELHPFGVNSQVRKEDWIIENLNIAYNELQDLHVQIRKQSKRTLGYSPQFFRAVEFHKSYVPHTHIVYFVRSSDVNKFLKIIKNKEGLNENIGRTETKVIDAYDPKNGKSPVSYLLKYLKKNIMEITKEDGDDTNLKIFNGWKNTLKIKQLYNNSIYKIPKWVIKKVSWYYQNFEELGYRSMLEAIESEVEIIQDSIQLDKTIKTKIINKVENPKYKIYRKIEKYEYINEDEEIQHADRILEYIITNENEEILFNKSDYVFLEDSELSKYQNLTKLEKMKISQLHYFLEYEKFIEFIKFDNINFVNNVDYKNDLYFKNYILQKNEYDILPFGYT